MIDAASYGRALFQLAEEDGCGDGKTQVMSR